MSLKNGVGFYTKGTALISVGFPEKLVRCQYCKFLTNESWAKRYRCLLTDERIMQPFEVVGWECPLEFEEEVN